MKPFTGYLILALGITTGIAANSFAKISEGFTKLTPTIACLLLMTITMFSLAKAMSVIPVAFSYSTYSGLTVAGVVIFGMLKYNQWVESANLFKDDIVYVINTIKDVDHGLLDENKKGYFYSYSLLYSNFIKGIYK